MIDYLQKDEKDEFLPAAFGAPRRPLNILQVLEAHYLFLGIISRDVKMKLRKGDARPRGRCSIR